jgi:hypothetical protein
VSGRPRSDQLALVERIVVVLLDDPYASSNDVQVLVRGRRQDVQRVLRTIRKLIPSEPLGAPASRFPNPEERS